MTLIRRDAEGARVVDDPFRAMDDDDVIAPGGDVIVSLARWRREREALLDREGRAAVRVPGSSDDADALLAELDGAAFIAIEIPKFSDGRAYSLARLLRRAGYRGELRALGDVLRDQLAYLSRCGFTTFELARGRDVADALAAFSDFSVGYQPAEDHDVPIWRRRASA